MIMRCRDLDSCSEYERPECDRHEFRIAKRQPCEKQIRFGAQKGEHVADTTAGVEPGAPLPVANHQSIDVATELGLRERLCLRAPKLDYLDAGKRVRQGGQGSAVEAIDTRWSLWRIDASTTAGCQNRPRALRFCDYASARAVRSFGLRLRTHPDAMLIVDHARGIRGARSDN